MTLHHNSPKVKVYLRPGTDEDGYKPPEWSIDDDDNPNSGHWHGGAGEWLYYGYKGGGTDDDPPVVYATRMGEDAVARRRKWLEDKLGSA